MSPTIVACDVCRRLVLGEKHDFGSAASSEAECAICLGLMNKEFLRRICDETTSQIDASSYDCRTFRVAVSMPTSVQLREYLLDAMQPKPNGILAQTPMKLRALNALLDVFRQHCDRRPILKSPLQVTVYVEQTQFDADDAEFVRQQPGCQEGGGGNSSRKRKADEGDQSNGGATSWGRAKLATFGSRLSKLPTAASTYAWKAPNVEGFPLTFRLELCHDTICIAGRYLKFSRSTPQSRWTDREDDDFAQKAVGTSVSERICGPLKQWFSAAETRFVASGREDVDVRMLGTGRPFVVFVDDPHTAAQLRGGAENAKSWLAEKERELNVATAPDVRVRDLTRVSREVADTLGAQDTDKRKTYTALCVARTPIPKEKWDALTGPVEVVQRTPVRVLRRRALLDRPRTVHSLRAVPIDERRALVRMVTQAGTYVKEFVSGDFGRTRPSLAELLDMPPGHTDLIELDVQHVDVDWPPTADVVKDL